jgi:fatty-acyl-CoA synthase
MPVEVFNAFENQIGIPIVEGYGLTEGTCVSAVNPKDGERRVGSVGFRLPYQPVKIAILDGKQTFVRECAVNEIGAVLVRGDNVFPGYKEEAHNKNIWVTVDKQEPPWLNTGDLGRMDADGYLWLTGREKELIIRGGHNIDPKLIEDPLHRHPAVALAAAVGRPDARVGELPVAYVQPEENARVSAEELLRFAKEHITERAAVPREIIIIEEMPLTTVGKIFKPRLVWREVEKVYKQSLSAIPQIRNIKVTAGPDKIHGMRAAVRVQLDPAADERAVEREINRVLGVFTVTFDLHMVT